MLFFSKRSIVTPTRGYFSKKHNPNINSIYFKKMKGGLLPPTLPPTVIIS
jgi:hypothetical protein